MPKKMSFKIVIDDDELFSAEIMTVVREKIAEIMRSEFDKIAKEECKKVIESRLLRSSYIDNPLKIAVREIMGNPCWQVPTDNPIAKAVEECFKKHWQPELAKVIQTEIQKGIRARMQAISSVMNENKF